jgi:hypothetical protein
LWPQPTISPGASVGIEIPLNVKRKIGLDDEPSWIIISEYNVKEWPNGGLSTIPAEMGFSHTASSRLASLQRSRRSFLTWQRRIKANRYNGNETTKNDEFYFSSNT